MKALKLRKILVPVNFSPVAEKAITHAVALAKKNDGLLILLHVHRKRTVTDTIFPGAELRSHAIEQAQAHIKLAKLAGQIRKQYDLPVQSVITTGSLPSSIVKAAERYSADLIVMGTRGSESESSFFFGSNSRRVVAASEIPVLTVRSTDEKAKYSKILLPLDLSRYSRQKVKSALKLAVQFDASLHMLGLLGSGETENKFKIKIIARQLEELATNYGVPVSHNIIFTDKPALETLVQARLLKADLIVTMTNENEGETLFTLINFDKSLVNESPVPVLSIQPEIRQENIKQTSLGGAY